MKHNFLGINPYALGQRIIVIDGHDGAGKSTLARLVSQELKGLYVKPFNDSLGDLIAWSHRRADFKFTDILCRAAIHKIYEEAQKEKLLVFDRHWLTMFTVLPESLRENWGKLPATVLCWTDENTTIERLKGRGEDPGEKHNHEYFCNIYIDLAKQHNIPIVNTTHFTIEECKDEICRYTKEVLHLE